MAVEKVEGHLLCKKFLMLVGACGLGVFALHGATCVWTGGSGTWTDSTNWLDGAVPSAGDTVYVSNSVAAASIDIDVPGVSIASIRFEGQGTVTLTGNALTLTGADGFSPVGVTGTLAVTDGARIEVDLSKYTGNRNVFRLFNFNSFDGDLDNVSLVLLDKDGVSRKVCRLSKTDTAIDFAFVNGTTILFR